MHSCNDPVASISFWSVWQVRVGSTRGTYVKGSITGTSISQSINQSINQALRSLLVVKREEHVAMTVLAGTCTIHRARNIMFSAEVLGEIRPESG